MGFNLASKSGGAQSYPGATCDDLLVTETLPTGNNNNYAPGFGGGIDYSNASTWELRAFAGAVITGIQGGLKGRRIVLINNGDNDIAISGESDQSDPENIFNFSMSIAAGSAVTIQYSGILSKWMLVAQGSNSATVLRGASATGPDDAQWEGGSVQVSAGATDQGGGVLINGGAATPTGFGGNVTIATGFSEEGFNGQLILQLGNDLMATATNSGGTKALAFTAWNLGFNGATPVPIQSITGTTEQEQIDSIVAALVAFGFVTDDR